MAGVDTLASKMTELIKTSINLNEFHMLVTSESIHSNSHPTSFKSDIVILVVASDHQFSVAGPDGIYEKFLRHVYNHVTSRF